MKIDLLGGSYQQRYRELNSQRTINWLPILTSQEEKSKSSTAIVTTPGLTRFCTIPGTYNRGIYVARTRTYDRCFTVVDQTLYEIGPDAAVVSIGVMSNIAPGSSKAWMIVNANNQLGIFTYAASYCYNLDTGILQQITTNQFAGNVICLDFMDGYGIILSPDNQFQVNSSVFYSTNNDFLSGLISTGWLSTNTLNTTFSASKIKAIKCYKEDIFMFTETDIGIYYEDGTSPFSRMPRSTISYGLAATESVAQGNNGMFFLGRTQSGECMVFFLDVNYTATSISPTSVTWALNSSTEPLNDAWGYTQYTKDGHCLYYLSIPSLKTTYIYNAYTNLWSERQSLNPVKNAEGKQVSGVFRGRYFSNFRSMNLFTDIYSGNILKEDYSVMTEDNTTIIRTRISEIFSNDYQNLSVNSLELDCNTGLGTMSGQGVNPVLMIQYSKDGGINYSSPRLIKLGAMGNPLVRAKLNKLGTGRNWVVKLTLADPVDLMINNAIAHGTVSVN